MGKITATLFTEPYGDDLMVVNMAKQSNDRRSTEVGPSEKSLIKFLATGMTTKQREDFYDKLFVEFSTINRANPSNWPEIDDAKDEIWRLLNSFRRTPTHWVPFAHTDISITITAPIIVARQLFKHVVGSVKSEESRRYIEDEVDVYFPDVIRSKPVDKKQGSGPPLGASESVTCRYIFEDTVRHSIDAYKALLGHSVAPELARGVLNQFAMTTWTDTASLYYWSQVYNTRSREDVQEETRMVADMLPGLISPYFPESWGALTNG